MFRSATLRLTLWYLAIAMAISVLFSVVLYHVTTDELMRGLHSESVSLYRQFPVFQNDPKVNFRPAPFYNTSRHAIIIKLLGFNLIVLITAGISSYLLARHTLEPIEFAHTQQKRFTSDVSHELRTPLTAIKMESEVALLNNAAPANELRETILSNLEEVGKLESLINNLLRLSMLEADELQHNFTSLDSQLVARQAIEKVAKTAEHKDISIISQGKSAEALGDQDSLVQLLTILLENSIKYSAKDSKITIAISSNKNSVNWAVKDHGKGIEAEALQHIFDRFYRADFSRNKNNASEGFGLGLSIAKMIADVHKGNITISSQVGHGTTANVSVARAETAKIKPLYPVK
jgi:two-component system sensor histidine kinase CiaH